MTHTASSSSVIHSTLQFRTYYMSWANSITMPCTCMNNRSSNQPSVVPELEIQAPSCKGQQCGVGDNQAAGTMVMIGKVNYKDDWKLFLSPIVREPLMC